MIKVDLSYNPYLIETKIRFNGREPRINSQVEKYQESMLQTWIERIPQIFHDEMNGYDFELDFNGTKLDYDDLEKIFESKGLLKGDVKLFYKNELDGRYTKVNAIEKLLKWLSANPNRKFDYGQFMDDNRELFGHTYPYIIVSGHNFDMQCFEDTSVSVETMESVTQLKNTRLLHTPIVFYLDAELMKEFQKQLRILRARNDVNDNQIFFMIDNRLSHDMVERIIIDLGLKNPQIVNTFNDESIMHYIEVYPVTDYIVNVLHVLWENINDIKAVLTEANEKSIEQNRAIHEEIDSYEKQIDLLGEVYDKFFLRDNLSLPDEWLKAKETIVSKIENWKINKTKVTKMDEAAMLSKELEEIIQKAYYGFLKEISEKFSQYGEELAHKYLQQYQEGDMDREYATACKLDDSMIYKLIPSISGQLLNIKNEEYVMPKEDILGRFFKTSTSNEDKQPVLERSYYFQQWREYALSIVEPVTQEVIDEYFGRIQAYEKEIAESYLRHLRSLIGEQYKKKDIVSSKLSDEEQKLQVDNDWIEDFENQVKVIERG